MTEPPATTFELGLYTFVERMTDPVTERLVSPEQRMRNLLEEIQLAEQVGLDVFGIGEHHRADYVASSPAVILAAAAARTRRLRLTSAVTVLSSDDPVRVFQDFATLDLLSGGRAEIMAGRGSFIESFPLFGYDLADYDDLFTEKLDLLLRVTRDERVTWTGRHRPALSDQAVFPRSVQRPLPVWVAVGGTPQSAVRAGTLGVPMALAIIGGLPERFAPLAQLYREAHARAGHATPPTVSINAHGYLAPTAQQARTEAYPYFAAVTAQLGRERGWGPFTREQYDLACAPRGAHFIGDADAVTDKILFQHAIFKHQRFLLYVSTGSMPHAQVMRAIELYGTRVAPAVRSALGSAPAAPSSHDTAPAHPEATE